jgi:hypothetical protein
MLLETHTWAGYDLRYTPRAPDEWQLVLFAAASSGVPEILRLALRHDAPPTGPIRRRWVGVANGQVRTCISDEPAYYWLTQRDRRQKVDPIIWKPMEAATAGGDWRCISTLAEAGANLREALTWLKGLEFNVPRVEGGLALLEAWNVATNPGNQDDAQKWLVAAQEWVKRQPRRRSWDSKLRDRFNAIYRRMDKVCLAFSVDPSISAAALTNLL